MNDNASEPSKGLPEPLPPGEQLLWQGSPCWRGLAWRAFHVREVAFYFGLILVWRAAVLLWSGDSIAAAALAALALTPVAAIAAGVLALLAWMSARTTIYTITNRRVVMKYGVALPITLNIPFRIVSTAGLRLHAQGTGDIPLSLQEKSPVAYIHLWPHARPWRVNSPEPMLRSVPAAKHVAGVLAEALRQASSGAVEGRGSAAIAQSVETPGIRATVAA